MSNTRIYCKETYNNYTHNLKFYYDLRREMNNSTRLLRRTYIQYARRSENISAKIMNNTRTDLQKYLKVYVLIRPQIWLLLPAFLIEIVYLSNYS